MKAGFPSVGGRLFYAEATRVVTDPRRRSPKGRFPVYLTAMNDRLSAYSTDDCIAALATPWGESALAVVRTSGEDAVERLAPAFSDPGGLLASAGGSLLYGRLIDPETDEAADEVVLGVFRGPRSYTGEDSVEIYCHGSPPGIREILNLLGRLGFRPAEPGEFTFRAFFHGKMDLTRAEAVNEIITAQTRKAHGLALHRLSGGVEERINEAKALLAEASAAVEIRLDYPEEDAPEAPLPFEAVGRSRDIVRRLLATYREGRLYQEGARVALAGRTNAGKSSLFNLFLREERSIVSEHHGTTRDYIEARVSVAGIPVILYDTAGLRTVHDPVETEGVRRSRTLIDGAALVVYIIDAEEGASSEDEVTIAALGDRGVPVWNKIDRGAEPSGDGRLRLSARTGEGFSDLHGELGKRLLRGVSSSGGEPVIDSERQKNLLERCLRATDRFTERAGRLPLDVVAEDLGEALRALGEITGEVTTEDMLGIMFSRFCVGK